MSLTPSDLKKIATLAYLDIDEHSTELHAQMNAILDFVEQLRQIDTTNVSPLVHPITSHQYVRDDEISEESCLAELAELAPLFEDGLYLVPKVVDEGN